jgi:hypothetical protein
MSLADTSNTQLTARLRQKALAVFHGNNPQKREQGPGAQSTDQSTYQTRRLGNMTYTTESLGSGAPVTDPGCGCTGPTPTPPP